MSVVGRGDDRQGLADRLDPVRLAMIVNEGNHSLDRRSSSAIAGACLAQDLVGLPKLAVLSLKGLQLVGQFGRNAGPLPAIDSPSLTQSCNICGVQPIFAAIEVTAAQREGCSLA
jgi:hypothetical protein